MLTKFHHRSELQELMDEPAVPQELLFETLRELDVINQRLGGHAVTLNGMKRLITDRTKIYTIADIGCGGGDAMRAIAKWARKENYKVQLLGIDINANGIEYMLQQSENYPEIKGVVSSYESFLSAGHPIDIIHCSLFCHHLKNEELVALFVLLKQQARVGFVINDLQRHWFAYYSIKFLTGVLSRSSLVKNDAPISVLRGFKKSELENIFQRAEVNNVEIRWRWAFRYLMLYKANKL